MSGHFHPAGQSLVFDTQGEDLAPCSKPSWLTNNMKNKKRYDIAYDKRYDKVYDIRYYKVYDKRSERIYDKVCDVGYAEASDDLYDKIPV